MTLRFETAAPKGEVRALEGVSLALEPEDSMALVGESGAGKSVLALAILGLLPPNARLQAERFACCGRDLLALDGPGWADLRRREVGVIWQNPQAALVPVYRVGTQLEWVLEAHGVRSRAERRRECERLLAAAELADPAAILRRYPGELSGGECQRVLVAAALAGRRRLLIADEPTSALDVRTQAAIMRLLARVCRERSMALLFITHDLALAAEACRRVLVLRRGRVVESGEAAEVFGRPTADYTRELLDCLPRPLSRRDS